MSAFASTDYKKINAAGPVAFESSGLITSLQTALQGKDAAAQIEALETVKSMAEGCDQWMEAYLVDMLPFILEGLAAPKTKDAATAAGNAILAKSNAHSVRIITSKLYESFTSMKWQTKKVRNFFIFQLFFSAISLIQISPHLGCFVSSRRLGYLPSHRCAA
jgi:hypothetical protein